MTRTSVLAAIAAASLALLSGSVPEIAAAHSEGDCANQVVESCNAQWPSNYEARIACAKAALKACESHSHGGSGGADPASSDFTSSGGGQEPLSLQRRLQLRQKL